jgi:hypothetical protein
MHFPVQTPSTPKTVVRSSSFLFSSPWSTAPLDTTPCTPRTKSQEDLESTDSYQSPFQPKQQITQSPSVVPPLGTPEISKTTSKSIFDFEDDELEDLDGDLMDTTTHCTSTQSTALSDTPIKLKVSEQSNNLDQGCHTPKRKNKRRTPEVSPIPSPGKKTKRRPLKQIQSNKESSADSPTKCVQAIKRRNKRTTDTENVPPTRTKNK